MAIASAVLERASVMMPVMAAKIPGRQQKEHHQQQHAWDGSPGGSGSKRGGDADDEAREAGGVDGEDEQLLALRRGASHTVHVDQQKAGQRDSAQHAECDEQLQARHANDAGG
jgi:hypothetical protein